MRGGDFITEQHSGTFSSTLQLHVRILMYVYILTDCTCRKFNSILALLPLCGLNSSVSQKLNCTQSGDGRLYTDFDDASAVLAFPKRCRNRLRLTERVEQHIEEIRIFPNRESILVIGLSFEKSMNNLT